MKKGTVLITGGAKRIGKALALALSEQGYGIALHYHTSEKQAMNLFGTLKKKRRRIQLFRCNLAQEEAVIKLTRQVKKTCPDYNILINNASVFKPSRLVSSSMTSFHDNMNIHFKAPYILTKHFAQQCKKGSIINIVDTKITQNKTLFADYLLSKKSLLALSTVSATELAPQIRVNAIAPGFILPPAGNAASTKKRLSTIPLKRKGSTQHVVQTAQFLIENDFITGQTIYCDGGEHLN